VIDLPVRSARLVIDALTIGDAEAVAAYRNDPDVARFQGWSLPYGAEQAAGLAAAGQLAIRVGGPGLRLIGDAMLAGVAGTDHAAEIGITLAPADQGRGFAAEAVTALVDAVFAAGRHKVVAYVDVRNARSLVLFDRLGFRREGLLHHSFKRADRLIDEVMFGLTADLWRHPTEGPVVELDPHPADVARLAEELFAFNAAAIGDDDGTEVAVFERDELGRIAGGAAGVAWAGGAELWLVWVREDRRGKGLGQRLLIAFEDAARARGAHRIFLTSHTFQAPDFYKRFGYSETGRRDGWPAGHADVLLEKDLWLEKDL
jgi:RimJ/RimL family protein N-acetyltransferase